MSPERAEEYLLGLELFGMRFGLDRMHKLMTALGMPQRRFAQIHVVGSNGKSSTTRFAAALLERHGVRSGSYTSPHLGSFRERVEVGEQAVSAERFATAVERAAGAARMVERTLPDDDAVTQFEALTAAAYHELAARNVEIAVIEAGLGGRYDATNVIPSRVQALTNVGLEHTRWLGPTVADIAAEKLAVVRDHGTLVIGADMHPDAELAARRAAERHGATLIKAPAALEGIELRAAGDFQRGNFALAAGAVEAMLGRPLDPAAVRSAAGETRIPGRMDIVDEHPLTIHDGAHNPAGARALASALPEVARRHGARGPLVVVLAVLEDKEAAAMIAALLGLVDTLILTRCANPRSLSPATLDSLAAQVGAGRRETVVDPRAAVGRARALAGPGGTVVATGSIYLVADLTRDPTASRVSAL